MARAAAVALCLLALAAGASAQCDNVGQYIKLDYVKPLADLPVVNEITTCLTSFKATIVLNDAGTCGLQITPLNSGGSYIKGSWTLDSFFTYQHWLECPTNASYIADITVDSTTIEDVLKDMMNNFPYGVDTANANTPIKPIDAAMSYTYHPKGGVKFVIGGSDVWYAITELTIKDTVTGDGILEDMNAPDKVTVVGSDIVNNGVPLDDWMNLGNMDELFYAYLNVHEACELNHYPIVMGEAPYEYKICAPCSAGTSSGSTGTGFGCTTCAAGTYSTIGGDCLPCPVGTYAHAGSSQCLPCPTGTYSGAEGAKECTECPEDSYAWIPGSQYCLRCIEGIPEACKDGVCPSDLLATPKGSSPGTMILSVQAGLNMQGGELNAAATCLLDTSVIPFAPEFEIKMLEQCESFADTSVVTNAINPVQMAFRVFGDCSITISPISDQTCASPTNEPASSNYTYGNLELRAYYYPSPNSLPGDVDPNNFRIMSLFDTFQDGQTPPVGPPRTVTESLLMHIRPAGVNDPAVFVRFLAGTSDPAMTNSVLQPDASAYFDTTIVGRSDPANGYTCETTWTVTAGALFSTGTAPAPAIGTTCPAGTYWHAEEYCPVCPVGYTCPGGASAAADKIPCEPNYYNEFLGFSGTCAQCDLAGEYTSYAGAESCAVKKVDINCELVDRTKGYQYDLAAQECILCPPGTYQDYANAGEACKLCPMGTYSGEGQIECTPCPKGQHSPSEGLPDQTSITGLACIACAEGSVALGDWLAGPFIGQPQTAEALTNPDDLRTGAYFCEACPAGTYKPLEPADPLVGPWTTCTACPDDTYRSGDATPENNECRPIPAGYRLKPESIVDGVLARSEIDLCPKGTVSFYDPLFVGGVRIPPADSENCAACSALDDLVNNIDPASYKWVDTYAPRKGMTQCIQCPAGTIPKTSTVNGIEVTDSCVACGNGQYRDPAIKPPTAACVQCGPGLEVGPNNKMACTACRPGYYSNDETQYTGVTNNEPDPYLRPTTVNFCQPCPKNYYRPTFGATSCLPCPRGTNTANTGNVECTACPIGYYNNQVGQECSPAPTGTFVNTTGAFVTTPCPKGSWNNEQANDNCNPCAPGKYSNTLGAKECKTCPAGTYSAGQATECLACRAGYAAPAGAASCAPCKPGTFAPDTKSATCKLCPKGYQCPTNAMSKEGPCPRGTFSNKEGNRLCTPCPVNTMSMGGGSAASPVAVMACIKCAPGTNTRGLVGQSRCQVIRPQVKRLMY